MENKAINEIYFDAPIQEVWWSISTIKGTNTYLTYTAQTDGLEDTPKVGDIYTLNYGDIINKSKIMVCEPEKDFVLSDNYESISPDGSVDIFRVSTHFHLEEVDSKVKLTLEVSGFINDTYGLWFRECIEMGWRRSLLNLKSVLELGLDLRTELFSYPRLGVLNCTVNKEQCFETGVSEGQGNYLLEVFPNSPAEKCGLQRGDVILEIDKKPVKNYEEFVKIISTFYGDKRPAEINYCRNNQKYTTLVSLSLEDYFTGLNLEGDTFESIREKRERISKQRSAAGSIWKEDKEGK
ncbi:PDZ domain-containing protein [Bacillus sp. 166amftsu]|uniref:PDZ domain-containing protein n=1 Tax=Bacillus sp. 166amftsu TaxID=1761753 RepID=UPI000898334E|nr:PDZ domain-containing protein [Bacillus sp. 166amftsu]SDZ37790.1 PDZ domain-containing protein [Bacillus sp. 166amftsu]